ncbi:hypothetical protein LJK88_02570 [Paenibacillus sp. P26]|nr:hypothetical protein LJK88_02570 [Paenibacillus sp. P26]
MKELFVIPLDNRAEERKLFDTIHRADGVSFIGKGMALAVAFSVIGSSKGFVLEWGPIYWGLIGAGGGFALGFLIDLYINKVYKKNKRRTRGKVSEVVLIVECENNQVEWVESLLWEHLALGLAKIKPHSAEMEADPVRP